MPAMPGGITDGGSHPTILDVGWRRLERQMPGENENHVVLGIRAAEINLVRRRSLRGAVSG